MSHEAPEKPGIGRFMDFQTGTESQHAGSQQVEEHHCRKRQPEFLRCPMTRDKEFGEIANSLHRR